MKYIYVSIFLLSFLVGLLYFYVSDGEKKVIYISPTPDNCNDNIYKDKSNKCFKYESREVSCNDITEMYIEI